MNEWQAKARTLADDLAQRGHLADPRWRTAFEAVPRHLFVPRFYRDDKSIVDGGDAAQRGEWLDTVYRDTSLTTQVAPVPGTDLVWATSSSTMPSLMSRMLELRDVHNGHRVLEVGTGTGYNAALLCHRLGDQNVASVDLHSGLVNDARDRLVQLGFRPHLVAGDGAAGIPEHAPYDRIIATCAVATIPPAWLTQLPDDGLIVADVRGEISSNLIALHKTTPDIAEGRFLPLPGHFMWLRADASNPLRDGGAYQTLRDLDNTDHSHTNLDLTILDNSDFRFFLQHHEPDIQPIWTAAGEHGEPVNVSASDGSWADVNGGRDRHTVVQGGPRRIWNSVELAASQWKQLGRPTRDRFGLTVNVDGRHQLWLDSPESSPLAADRYRPLGECEGGSGTRL